MRDAPPTRTEVLTAGVLPALLALIVAAVMFVERAQTDWAAIEPLANPIVDPDLTGFSITSWFTFVFAFSGAHLIGATHLAGADATTGTLAIRALKTTAFAASFLLPSFGFLLLAIGLGSGVTLALTLSGIFIVPIVSPVLCGLVFGLLFAIAAGPTRAVLPDDHDHRRLQRLLWPIMKAGAAHALTVACAANLAARRTADRIARSDTLFRPNQQPPPPSSRPSSL